MKRDMLGIVEAAYAVAPEEAWRSRLTESMAALDEGLGVTAVRIRRARDRAAMVDIFGTSDAGLMSAFRGMIPRIAPEDVRTIFQFVSCGETASSFAGERFGPYQAMMAPHGCDDCLSSFGLVNHDETFGVYVPLPLQRIEQRRRSRKLRLVGAHLGAAMRARQRGATDEAWFEPGGRLLDARGSAVAAREALRDRVRAVDRARAGVERSDEGLGVWTALVEGRWSLVDQFDADGRRFVVARRNAPDLGRRLALTEREEQVAKLHAMGHPSKYVAYELGVSPATVSVHLERALLKLGVRTKAQLIGLYDELVA